MDNYFDEEENDLLEPAAEEQHEEHFGDLLDNGDLPPLDAGLADEEEYVPEPDPEPQQERTQRQTTQDRRQLLQQLARKAQAGAEEGGRKKKGKKDKREKQQEQRGSRPKRLRQSAADAADGGSKRPRAPAAELPEDQYVETAEDQDFIDDAGVPEDERYEGDDLEVLARAEEAEEAAFGEEEEGEPTNIVDEVIRSRKRRRKASDEQIESEVMSLVTQMQACANKDCEIVDGNKKMPAMNKFQALKAVNDLLRQRSHHESFIQLNGLEAIAGWLRPYANGALPLMQIRTTLIDLLGIMNLDTGNEYTRLKLENSGLGKIIMFYEKNPLEKSASLRAKCRDLILAWSAPIFADADAEFRKRRAREREHRHRMVAQREGREQLEARELKEAEKRRKANAGEEGYRARAAVPQPSRMDFVINPGSRIDPLDGPLGAGLQSGAKQGPPKSKAMPTQLEKQLAQKKRGSKDRFGGVSVEGRGLMV